MLESDVLSLRGVHLYRVCGHLGFQPAQRNAWCGVRADDFAREAKFLCVVPDIFSGKVRLFCAGQPVHSALAITTDCMCVVCDITCHAYCTAGCRLRLWRQSP